MDELNALIHYIRSHAERSHCECGRCNDSPEFTKLTPAPQDGVRHTADVIFFKVQTVNDANADELRRLITGVPHGTFNDVNFFDGEEHGYIEIGGWIGDQGLALVLMGMGYLLGLWDLLTPRSVLPPSMLDDELIMQMAGGGLITIKAVERAINLE